ncbi:hypothetical protein ABIE52_004691 [Rhodococcus sp. OAS809]
MDSSGTKFEQIGAIASLLSAGVAVIGGIAGVAALLA